jgi:hypothetical protein
MHSPFIIVQDFLSPLTCEKIVSDIRVGSPDLDVKGDPKKLERHDLFWEQDIIERFRPIVPEIEERYNCNYTGLEKPLFQYFPENAKVPAENPGCENSKYIRKKWVMYKDVDLVGFVWLKDYQENVPLDPNHEVFGGKLEFPAYNFSLVPQRGTLVMYPAGPHFITVISPILLGELYQIKLTVSIKHRGGGRWFYQPQSFPGTWQQWFEGQF